MKLNSNFSQKTIFISGGTGSFGNCALNRFLETDVAEIRIYSRDEKKQDDMRNRYSSERVKFFIGDVRDYQSILSALSGVDLVFHSAALKQVPSCEFHPLQATKTNVLGTDNVLNAAIASGVESVICLSTDKAVYPINAMGISKALMEKIAIARSRAASGTKICVTRYGNVMGSRGSVIPLFINQILKDQPITITNSNMTRFMMTLNEALDLVIHAFNHGASGDILVKKAPAATIQVLATAICEILGKPDHPIHTIGTRHGEKLYETLLTAEEMAKSIDLGEYYQIPPDLRDLNYSKYTNEGAIIPKETEDYNSHNTYRLDVEEMKEILLRLPIMEDAFRGEYKETES